MGLVSPVNSIVNDASIMRQYFLDVRLLVYSIDSNESKDFGGLDTYTVEAFRNNVGFGITNIEIETNASLQPVVEITFKDLYGNSVFTKDASGKANGMYKELFDWPPPKFDLSFKGYLGKTTRMKLNLKKTDIQYNSSDGSFTIKCSFVPNLWGPFADIPTLFLHSVKGLKQKEDPSNKNIVTFFDLIKIGKQVEVKTKNISNTYDSLKKKVQGADSLVSSIVNGDINTGEVIKGVAANKNGVISGFNNITVYDIKNEPSTRINTIEALKSGAESFATLNNYWLLKSKVDGTKSGSDKLSGLKYEDYVTILSSTGSTSTTSNGLTLSDLTDFLNDRKLIVAKDLSLIDDEISAEAYELNKDQLSQIVISDIFSKLGGDTGYILGNILRAGIEGHEGAKDARDNDSSIIGKYYPLYFPPNSNGGLDSNNTQAPIPLTGVSTNGQSFFNTQNKKLTNEWDFVNKFTEAISVGLGDAAVLREEFDSKGRNKLVRRINNLEALQGNPYNSSFESIVSNLIVRSGIWSYFTKNTDPNTPGSYFSRVGSYDDSGEAAGKNEVENITDAVLQGVSQDDLLKLKNTCIYFEKAISDSDKPDTFDPKKKIELVSGGTGTSSLSYDYKTALGSAHLSIINAGIPNGTEVANCLVNNQLFWINDFNLINKTYQSSARKPSGEYNMVCFKKRDDIDALKEIINSPNDTKYRTDTETQDDPGLLRGNEPPGFSSIDVYNGKDDKGKDKPGYGRIKHFNYWNDEENSMFNYDFFVDAGRLFSSVNSSPNNSEGLRQVNTLTDAALWNGGTIDSTNSNLPVSYCAWSYPPNNGNCWNLFGDDPNNRSSLQRAFVRSAFSELRRKIENISNENTIKVGNIAAQAQKMNELIYTQFHNIFYQWYSIIYDENKEVSNGAKKTISKFKSGELPQKIEDLYSGSSIQYDCSSSGGFSKGFQYIAPLIRTKNGGPIDVQDSVINLESCYNIDANTTVLNVIQNICTKNNFLFFPIAGGDPYNVKDIFTPELVSTDENFGNRFVVLWAPTPESRSVDNKGTDLSFIQKKEEIQVCAFEVQIGSTDNALFKNVNVSTDSTRTTAESVVNLQRLVDKQVDNKVVTKDCSTIPVIEGRSYTCEVETLGNAQISPLQYFYLDKVPIFGGLYQIMGTKHSITPNNMKTTFKGYKMRYNAGKYGGTPPVTLNSLAELSQKLNIVSNTGGIDNTQAQVGSVVPNNFVGSATNNDNFGKLDSTQAYAVANLHEKAQTVFTNFILDIQSNLGYHVFITSGYRSFEKQADLKNDNEKNASVGFSMHNYGLALDINLQKSGQNSINKSSGLEAWNKSGVVKLAKEKYNLFWGGDLKNYLDPVHFDLRNLYGDGTKLYPKALAQFGSKDKIDGKKINLG